MDKDYNFSESLRFIAIDNPSDFLASEEVMCAFARCLDFRIREYRKIWPQEDWAEGVDFTAIHFFALHEGEPIAAFRVSPYRRHSRYGTLSSYLRIFSRQEQALRTRLLSTFEDFGIRESLLEHSEAGQLIVHRDYRGTRKGLALGVRDALLSFAFYSCLKIRLRQFLALTHEEMNTFALMERIGFRVLNEFARIQTCPGATSRLVRLAEFNPSYWHELRAHREYFERKGLLYTMTALSDPFEQPTTPAEEEKSHE